MLILLPLDVLPLHVLNKFLPQNEKHYTSS